jgi:hypothetical protein
MNMEYSDQSKENLSAIIKQCQICDFPMAEAELYCHSCGALWCKADNNLEEKSIIFFDSPYLSEYTVMPLCPPPAGYSGFSFA